MSSAKKAQRTVEIYGISGPKGVGKDTFANLICAAVRTTPFHIRPLAGPLKSQIARIFPVARESLDDRALKEAQLPLPIQMDDYLERMRLETGLPLLPRGLVARSRRALMQFYGTDYVRTIQEDYWAQLWRAGLHGQLRVLVPDARFPNEIEQLRVLGGKVIRLSRSDVQVDSHSSESSLATSNFDLELNLIPGELDILRRVARLIAMGKFSNAHVFHWPAVEDAIRMYTMGASLEDSAKKLGIGHKDPYTLKNLLSYYSIPIRTSGSGGSTRIPHKMVDGAVCKQCCSCKTYRQLTDFNATTKTWDGLAGSCRSCAAEHNKARYIRYEKRLDWDRWLRSVKSNAARRGLQCHISVDDIKAIYEGQDGRCWYSGRQLSFHQGDADRVSVDRVDSSKHYTIDNIVLCSVTVNKMKQDMSVAEFHVRALEIVNYQRLP